MNGVFLCAYIVASPGIQIKLLITDIAILYPVTKSESVPLYTVGSKESNLYTVSDRLCRPYFMCFYFSWLNFVKIYS